MSERITFSTFLAKCGFVPTDGQRALIRVAFDGEEPRDLGTDRDVARRLFGDVDVVPPLARAVLNLVKGRGIGGTFLSAHYMLYLMLTLPFPMTAAGEIAYGVGVAPDKATARQIVRFARGGLSSMPSLERRIVSEDADGFTLRRRDGKLIAIEVFAASRGGSSFRGRTIGAMVLTEAAFCRDQDSVVNAHDLFSAARPRLVPGGMIILESTPWGELGLLWELDRDNFNNPSTSLAARAPTEMMRDDEESIAMVAMERERDPENARRELDCSFITGGESCAWIRDDVMKSYDAPPGIYIYGRPFIALDPASKSNTFAGITAQWLMPSPERPVVLEPHYEQTHVMMPKRDPWGRVVLGEAATHPVLSIVDAWGWTGEELRATDMESIVADIARHAHDIDASAVFSDQHGDVFLASMLKRHGVQLRSFSQSAASKHDAVMLLRQLMRDGQFHIATEHEHLRKDLLTYPRRIVGGGFRYGAPRAGHHWDWASALVILAHSFVTTDERNKPANQRYAIDGAPTYLDRRMHEAPTRSTL